MHLDLVFSVIVGYTPHFSIIMIITIIIIMKIIIIIIFVIKIIIIIFVMKIKITYAGQLINLHT
jgi:hypothetical protein